MAFFSINQEFSMISNFIHFQNKGLIGLTFL